MPSDLIAIYNDATSRQEEAQRVIKETQVIRGKVVASLHESGLSYRAIGRLLDLSEVRVQQLAGHAREAT